MPKVAFTKLIQRHLTCQDCVVAGASVMQVLENLFRDIPQLRSYLLDDQQRLRQHVAIFIDGAAIKDRARLSDAVTQDSTIYIMQALSGG